MNCGGVETMLDYANYWQSTNDNNAVPYNKRGPNSNSFAALIGAIGGFFPTAPFGAVGWNYPW